MCVCSFEKPSLSRTGSKGKHLPLKPEWWNVKAAVSLRLCAWGEAARFCHSTCCIAAYWVAYIHLDIFKPYMYFVWRIPSGDVVTDQCRLLGSR